MADEALNTNTLSDEALARNGTEESSEGFGRGRFGMARFGHSSGYELEKEALASNSLSEEELSSSKIGS